MITLTETEYEALKDGMYLLQNYGMPEEAEVVGDLLRRAYAAEKKATRDRDEEIRLGRRRRS